MKKLKLNLQHLDNAEVLTRAQLKTILGGEDGSGGGGGTCTLNTPPSCPTSGSCTGTTCSTTYCKTETGVASTIVQALTCDTSTITCMLATDCTYGTITI